MTGLSRRTFLAASAATLGAPAVVLAQGLSNVDVAVVGAGAAGIAAARRIVAAGRSCLLLEASDRIGGRCFTDTRTFGIPWDRGAHRLYAADINPLARRARDAGLEIRPAPPGPKLRIGPRVAREAELEQYFAALVRTRRALAEAAEEERDVAAARALPKDLGEWRPAVEFALGPFACGKNLDEASVQDLARAAERDGDAVVRPGYGALMEKLAEGLPVRLATPVTRIATWRGVSYVETPRGTLQARAVIVTASTNVLAGGKIKFEPALPKPHLEAMTKLALGSYERIAVELGGGLPDVGPDELVLDKAKDARTAALRANIGGTPLCCIDVAGKFGRGLAAQGAAAMAAFAVDWLAGLFGADTRKAVRRTHTTGWGANPWALGAFSCAVPGAQGARRTLAEPVRERIHFAGEAASEAQWGTVEGAWSSGDSAAGAALKRLGGAPVRRLR
jgi:monoamine oxidase